MPVTAARPAAGQLAGAVLVCTGVLAASRAVTRPRLKGDPVGDDGGPGRVGRRPEPQAGRAWRKRA